MNGINGNAEKWGLSYADKVPGFELGRTRKADRLNAGGEKISFAVKMLSC